MGDVGDVGDEEGLAWILLGRDGQENVRGVLDHLMLGPTALVDEGGGDDCRRAAACCGFDIRDEGDQACYGVIRFYDDEWKETEYNKYICPLCLDIYNLDGIDLEALRAEALAIVREELGKELGEGDEGVLA